MNEERGWLSAVLFFYSLAKICAQKMKKRLFSGILLAVTPGILSSSCIKVTKPEEGFDGDFSSNFTVKGGMQR